MKKINLSIAIATFNEQKNIERCLRSISKIADEIVIVDGGSGDMTVQLAEKMGARVIKTRKRPMFHINKNIAIENCKGEWILQLDADEEVPAESAEEIKQIADGDENNPISAYWIKRKNYFLGKFLKKGGQYPDPVIRLFMKGRARLPERSVHEQMEVEGRVGWLQNDLIHWGSANFAEYLKRANRYSTLRAKDLADGRIHAGLFIVFDYLIIKPILIFFSIYFLHKGLIDGWPGFVFALFSAFHYPWSFVKFIKMKLNKSKYNIEGEWR